MNCNNICQYFHFVNSATIVGGNLVLTFSQSPTGVTDPTRFCFRFSTGVTLPTGYETLPVVATINGTSTPLWDRYGDIMLGNELKLNQVGGICSRFVYKGYFGSQTDADVTTYHLIITNAPKPLCRCS